ncbi:Nlrc4p [Branchiostoma belcheri]|nr:Nlrc4p [Branchiostoma belcheri]
MAEGQQGGDTGVRKYFFFIKEKVASDWKDLAFHLGFEKPGTDNIAGSNRDDKSCCMHLLEEWLKRNGERATKEVLMEALSKAKLQSTVDGLKMASSTSGERGVRYRGKKYIAVVSRVGVDGTHGNPAQYADFRVPRVIFIWLEHQKGRIEIVPKRCTQSTLVDVADYFDQVIENVSYKWEDLARKLGFKRGEIKSIDEMCRNPDARCREMLERWQGRNADGATLQVLKQALIDIGERLRAESLKLKVSQASSTSGERGVRYRGKKYYRSCVSRWGRRDPWKSSSVSAIRWSTMLDTERGALAATSGNNEHCPGNAGRPAVSETGLLFTLISKQTHGGTTWI